MSIISKTTREICAKIVYYGPGLSGKTTTLKRIYDSVRAANRGEMISLSTEGDRTLFFDFLPIRVEKVGDCTVRLALYTVPGQVFYNATRKLVLQGADGVVFVADSQPAAMDNNLESMENLRQNLRDMGLNPEQHPLVIQYNKRDLGNALPIEELRRQLNPMGVPEFETIAEEGKGILESLRGISRLVIRALKNKGVSNKLRKVAPVALEKASGPSLSSQLESQVEEAASAPALATGNADPSLMTALVPDRLAADAALAEADYRAGHYREAFQRALDTLRVLLSSFGPEGASEVELALMAGLSGPDYSRLLRLQASTQLTREESAFGLFMLALAGVRLRR